MATVELVDNPVDGQQFHGPEISNFMRAAGGFGVQTHAISSTVTGSDLNITMPALTNVRTPNGSGGLVTVSPGGSAVGFSTNSGNFARTDILCVNDAGAYQVVEGTPTEETGTRVEAPMPALPTDAVMVAKVRFEASATVVAIANVFGRAIDVSDTIYLDADAISAVEGEATLDLAGDVTIDGAKSLKVDVIDEKDADAGVTIDGVLLKDGAIADGAVPTTHSGSAHHTEGVGYIFATAHKVTGTSVLESSIGTHAGASLGTSSAFGTAFFSFALPSDFAAIVKYVAIFIATQTGNARLDFLHNFGADGEGRSTHTDSIAEATYGVVANEILEMDISAGLADALAGDVIGVNVTRDGADALDTITTIHFIGVALEYSR